MYFKLCYFYFVKEQNIYGLCFLSYPPHLCFSLRSIIKYVQHLLPVLLHKIFQSFLHWVKLHLLKKSSQVWYSLTSYIFKILSRSGIGRQGPQLVLWSMGPKNVFYIFKKLKKRRIMTNTICGPQNLNYLLWGLLQKKFAHPCFRALILEG